MLLIGVAGTELTAQERDWLQHDAVAGVVLFKRNFASRQQVTDLSGAIRAAAPRPQLICVDQEGGRVQRFREGYSALPPLEGFGRLFAQDRAAALALAREHAWLMASEIRASGEIAVVVRRGASGNTPIVSAVMNRHGDALGSPVRRDTAAAEHGIAALATAQMLRVKLSPHQLYDRRYEA